MEKAPGVNSVLNVKALVGAFNQEKALVASRGLLRYCENRWIVLAVLLLMLCWRKDKTWQSQEAKCQAPPPSMSHYANVHCFQPIKIGEL